MISAQVSSKDPRAHLADTLGFIYQRGMTTTSGGNLSIRGKQGEIWITPAGVDKGTLKADDIVCIESDGSVLGKHRASSENPIHRSIYNFRPDVGALIHAHPEALVAYALAGKTPELNAIPQARMVCGKIAFAPYELPGSEKLGLLIAETFAKDSKVNAVIMENHGVVVAGVDLDDALQRFETLELCARSLIHASELGSFNLLSDEQQRQFESQQLDFIKVPANWVSSDQDRILRKRICEIVQRACCQGLMISSYGTVSMRAEGDDHFVMTPHGVSRLQLTEDDLVSVKAGEVTSGGRASRAVRLHRAIYNKYPEISSIITTQTPSVMAHAIAHQVINVHTNPESWVFVRDMSLLPFGIHVSVDENEKSIVPESLTPDFPVAIVENDCVIAIGGDIIQTYDRIEVAEFTAKSNIMAARIGGAQAISGERIEELREAFLT